MVHLHLHHEMEWNKFREYDELIKLHVNVDADTRFKLIGNED